ncbi:sensor histidine kinase [Marinomonas sp. MED121]|uniref:sensor histidine kinase n=1 Tax=Marinomonas sp. MED121 TaxID=314277 RepID=UPI0000690B77|nr:HAMP domain-containing sensor histidine kinase [Marinomonas sp. MED121]EAQ66064.1 sensor histidine kinase [Marinomonas sp. MED121]
MKWLARLNSMPLMLRLLGIFLSTCLILVMILVSGIHCIADNNRDNLDGFENLFADYGKVLSSRIGSPPDYEKAQALANEFMLNISVDGPTENWHSQPYSRKHDMDRLIALEYDESSIQNASFAKTRGNYYVRVLVEEKQEKYVFYISKRRDFIDFKIPASALFIFLLMPLVLYISYRITKRMFAPIKTLQAASLEYAKGNLSHQVEIKRDDELGSLTRVMNDMARQIDKMLQAKRQMLLAISHELRTPLTRLKLATELLDTTSEQSSLRRDILEMENLINEILESERLNSNHKVLNFESLDLGDLIQGVVNELNPNFDQRVYFDLSPLKPMLLDLARMRLLMRNLIVNALQHSKTPVEVRLAQQDDEVLIEVLDKGEGILQEHIPHLTQAFYRIDDARQRKTGGFGLGLYLCQLIVDAHMGELNIESEVSRGTKVSIV